MPLTGERGQILFQTVHPRLNSTKKMTTTALSIRSVGMLSQNSSCGTVHSWQNLNGCSKNTTPRKSGTTRKTHWEPHIGRGKDVGRKMKSGEETFVCRVKISFDAKKYKGGEYALMLLLGEEGESQRLLGTISVLVGGGVYAHCASRAKGMVSYKVHCSADITDIDGAKAAMLKENLQFTRNGEEIDIDAVCVEHWELAETEMEDERASA
mmetsp:Transcript_24178/g.36637  ORF Transcript_24178/g.36637 Transcript_24178/m.36637 type:complete len:210 (+) Transcript_24178:824-1453(+)|eukprot:scaffold3307_cov116-Skeletonema_dohrnii-CCMP3373.AAC.13